MNLIIRMSLAYYAGMGIAIEVPPGRTGLVIGANKKRYSFYLTAFAMFRMFFAPGNCIYLNK